MCYHLSIKQLSNSPSLNDECQLMIEDVSNGLDTGAWLSIFSGCCTKNDESIFKYTHFIYINSNLSNKFARFTYLHLRNAIVCVVLVYLWSVQMSAKGTCIWWNSIEHSMQISRLPHIQCNTTWNLRTDIYFWCRTLAQTKWPYWLCPISDNCAAFYCPNKCRGFFSQSVTIAAVMKSSYFFPQISIYDEMN